MLIEQLLSVDVVGVGAGTEHVVVVGGQGDVYAWGRGQGGFLIQFLTIISRSHPSILFQGGRLGLGTEEDVCTPKEVKMNKRWGKLNYENNVDFDHSALFAGKAEHRRHLHHKRGMWRGRDNIHLGGGTDVWVRGE